MMRSALYYLNGGVSCIAAKQPPESPVEEVAALQALQTIPGHNFVAENYYLGEKSPHFDPNDKARLANRRLNLPKDAVIIPSTITGHIAIVLPGEW